MGGGGGMKIICRLRARLRPPRRPSQPPIDLRQTQWGFAVDKIRWVGVYCSAFATGFYVLLLNE